MDSWLLFSILAGLVCIVIVLRDAARRPPNAD